jgi:two-component system, sensor histidine kinase
MRDQVTSWRRLSDGTRDEPGTPSPAAPVNEAELQAWEQEGGKTAAFTSPQRILIVDNDVGAAHSLEIMLNLSGYLLTCVAYSGAAALAMAADFRPDVIVIELGLFDSNSYEVAQSLREQAQSRSLRMIALTSNHEHAAREQARFAGFERYLVKPVAALDLSALLEQGKD